jgi:hypothetical protein
MRFQGNNGGTDNTDRTDLYGFVLDLSVKIRLIRLIRASILSIAISGALR